MRDLLLHRFDFGSVGLLDAWQARLEVGALGMSALKGIPVGVVSACLRVCRCAGAAALAVHGYHGPPWIPRPPSLIGGLPGCVLS